MRRKLFISFEGTDGAGKTTQVELLENYFTENKIDFISCREPGGTKISEKIREIIIDRNNCMSEYTEALLYAAARAELVNKVIVPSLEQGKIVLCDRFIDSSIAYQGFARNLGTKNIEIINNFGTKGLLPDVTFFLDIPPNVAIKRRNETSIPDRIEMEKIEFHENVYNGFLALCNEYPKRIYKINAENEPLIIHNNIIDIIKNFL